MHVSFVIPAHNEELNIGRTLASIERATLGAFAPAGITHDVIVVDDDSTDQTGQVAGSAGARVLRVRLRRIGRVRNAGAREAAGDVLIFVDADTEIDAPLLSAAVDAIRRGAVGGGACGSWREKAPWWGRWILLQWNLTSRLLRVAAGAFFFVRRADFQAVGGFDPAYYCAEEVALSRALKQRGRFVILPRHFRTSARKVLNYGFFEALKIFIPLVMGGEKGFTRPEGKEIWYARRDEPSTEGTRPSPAGDRPRATRARSA